MLNKPLSESESESESMSLDKDSTIALGKKEKALFEMWK